MKKNGKFSYERFQKACMKKGEAPSHVVENCGIHRAAVTRWAGGEYSPSAQNIMRISDYLGVDKEYLLGTQEQMRIKSVDTEVQKYLDAAKDRPELRVLMHTAMGATKEDVESMLIAYQYRKTLGE